MITLDEMFKKQDASVKTIQSEIREIHGPVWAAKGDLAKILITLNSAIFGAVVAFSKGIFEGASQAEVQLVLIALLALIISLVGSLFTIGSKINIEGMHVRYFNQRQVIRAESQKLEGRVIFA